VHSFVSGETLSTDLVRAALQLAQCNRLFRAGPGGEFGKPTAAQVTELRALIRLVDASKWQAKTCCLLNPTFGTGSQWIKADADVLLDDTLIDIKTVTDLSVTTRDWRQLIGYAALNEYFPIGGAGRRPIRHLGIYFAR
jgi:hypothetical protein